MNNNVTLREVNRVVLSCTLAIVLVICQINNVSVKETLCYLLTAFIVRFVLYVVFTIIDTLLEYYNKNNQEGYHGRYANCIALCNIVV